eukprot:923984-Pyramimonas_sp.AAC.1
MAGGIFGTEVYGVSDRELLGLRRMGMSTIKPRAQGRSLSVISLLEGAPPWRAAVASIVRWSREIWILQTHSFAWSLSWAELRAGWEQVFQVDDLSWSKVSGPISALRMSLYRLGWSMSNYCALKDDFGREISMTLNSPQMIKLLCNEAVLR